MRNYLNTLLFESALDSTRQLWSPLKDIAYTLFYPTVRIAEADCGTQLGTMVNITDINEGLIEISTGLPITRSSLIASANTGASSIPVRNSYSCISKDGVCKKCLESSYPDKSPVTVGSSVKLPPQLLVDSVFLQGVTGSSTLTLPHDASEYDFVRVFDNGILISNTSYTISGSTLNFTYPFITARSMLVKFYINSYASYYHWLVNTYSGSLLGAKPLYEIEPPIKPSLLTQLINEEDISYLQKLLFDPAICTLSENDLIQYLPVVKDPLEKAIYTILLSSAFIDPNKVGGTSVDNYSLSSGPGSGGSAFTP